MKNVFETLASTPPNGYGWIYFDGESDDGLYRFVCIAMVGNIFSPSYHRAKLATSADPWAHCAFNLAIYAPTQEWWVFSEYIQSEANINAREMTVGPNHIQNDGLSYRCQFSERTATLLNVGSCDVEGEFEISAPAFMDVDFSVDPKQEHIWKPIAPFARFSMRLKNPNLQFSGNGYIDHNHSAAAPEQTLSQWRWARYHLPSHEAELMFYIKDIAGEEKRLHLLFDAHGHHIGDATYASSYRRHRWGLNSMLDRPHGKLSKIENMEDAPFYSRNALHLETSKGPVRGISEHIDFDRFKKPWVQFLTPFKIRAKSRS